MSSGIATVKAVKSGDCVVLMGKAAAGKRPEIELTLSSLIAPHMGNRSRDEEEFGNASREFLRNLVIGKRVAFKVDYKVDAIRRTFGAIDLDGVGDVGTAIVRNGWANVRPSRDGDDQCAANIDELMALAEAAKAGGIGMFNKKAKASKKKWNIAQNERLDEKAATALLKELKKSPQEIIIEHVLDGAAVRATLVSREPKVSMVIAFSGIVCPRVRPMAPRKRGPKPADGEAAAAPKSAPLDPEPFALEARDFTEVRLLHRRLEVLFEGVGRNGKFYGTVVHKKGNIGVKLVEVGLAKVQEWTLIFASKAAQQAARAGQNDAKKKKKHLWANYVAPAMPKPFRGTVVDVVNTDTIVVQPSGGGEERRVALASIRAPWLGRRDERPKPWAYECAELLRKSCIGKQVEVTIDYTRGADPTRPPKEFGTVTLKSGRGNVAVAIAAAGLAEAERHRAGEEAAYACVCVCVCVCWHLHLHRSLRRCEQSEENEGSERERVAALALPLSHLTFVLTFRHHFLTFSSFPPFSLSLSLSLSTATRRSSRRSSARKRPGLACTVKRRPLFTRRRTSSAWVRSRACCHTFPR